MDTATIAALVIPWYQEGRINAADYERLKAQWLEDIEAPPGRCTTCSGVRGDVLNHFRYQLKQLGYFMQTSQKYLIAEEYGYIRLSSDPRLIVNECGDDEPNRQRLTTELAESLIGLGIGYEKQIVLNPNYKEPEVAAKAGKKGKDS